MARVDFFGQCQWFNVNLYTCSHFMERMFAIVGPLHGSVRHFVY